MAVQTHLPWYWRWVGFAALLGVAIAAAAWIYDAGRRFAGFDNSQVQQELRKAKDELAEAHEKADRKAEEVSNLERKT